GVEIEDIRADTALVASACAHISSALLGLPLGVLPDARISDVPTSHCEGSRLRSVRLNATVPFSGIDVEVGVVVDLKGGFRIIPPDLERLAVMQLVSLVEDESLTFTDPIYSFRDGLTLHLHGSVPTPFGLDLEAGFRVSPKRSALTGPV